jgi:hypothetical protein
LTGSPTTVSSSRNAHLLQSDLAEVRYTGPLLRSAKI